MRVRVLLQEDEGTLAATIVRLVRCRCDDPIPTEVLEVYRQRVAAAARLLRVLVAVQAAFALRTPTFLLGRLHLDEWSLKLKEF